MTTLIVRQFKDTDFPAARKIFIAGCQEHAWPVFYLALRLPRTWLLILLGLLLPLVTVGSILLAIVDVVVLLALLYLGGRNFFYGFATQALKEEMGDITKYYVKAEGNNFWVVESEGELVGMVAACLLPGEEKNLELKRMFVIPSQRGKGIAKLLCRTVIEYAQKKGCAAVVLSTTTVQTSATYMYRSVGFRCTHTSPMSRFIERLTGLQWVHLRYDISKSK